MKPTGLECAAFIAATGTAAALTLVSSTEKASGVASLRAYQDRHRRLVHVSSRLSHPLQPTGTITDGRFRPVVLHHTSVHASTMK